MARSTAEETSVRKRLSLPAADESVLQWWDAQHDVALSLRMLIRNEIGRNGFADTAFGPVTQQPKRGRPSLVAEPNDSADEPQVATPVATKPERVAPVTSIKASAVDDEEDERAEHSAPSVNLIDALMNG